jgi:hypothetical protein
MTAPPDVEHPKGGISAARYLFIAARLVVGYVLAIGTGAIVFSLTAHIAGAVPFLPDPIEHYPLRTIGQTAFLYFVLGSVFGIPYTLFGTLAFWFWLPRKTLWFLAIGTLCPAAALLLFFSMAGGITFSKMLKLLLVTLPAGLAAAYVYGAIGFGRGFGRWRWE